MCVTEQTAQLNVFPSHIPCRWAGGPSNFKTALALPGKCVKLCIKRTLKGICVLIVPIIPDTLQHYTSESQSRKTQFMLK